MRALCLGFPVAVGALTATLCLVQHSSCDEPPRSLHASLQSDTGVTRDSSYFIKISGTPEAWKVNQKVLFDAFECAPKSSKGLGYTEFREGTNSFTDGVHTVGTIEGKIENLLVVPSQSPRAAFELQFSGNSSFSLASHRSPVAIPFSGVSRFSVRTPVYHEQPGGFSAGPVVAQATTGVYQGPVLLTRHTCFPRLVTKFANGKAKDAVPDLKNRIATETTQGIAKEAVARLQDRYQDEEYTFERISFRSTGDEWTLLAASDHSPADLTESSSQYHQNPTKNTSTLHVSIGEDVINRALEKWISLPTPQELPPVSIVSLVKILPRGYRSLVLNGKSIYQLSSPSQQTVIYFPKSPKTAVLISKNTISVFISFEEIKMAKDGPPGVHSVKNGTLELKYTADKSNNGLLMFTKTQVRIYGDNGSSIDTVFRGHIDEWFSSSFVIPVTHEFSVGSFEAAFNIKNIELKNGLLQFDLFSWKAVVSQR